MDNHLLFELTYVLYRIRSTIIHGERWLVELSRKFCLFYPPCKEWFRNLAQCLLHNISSYSFARRASAFPLVKMLFLTRERFAWWSSRSLSVHSIFFIVGRDIRVVKGPLLLCSLELLLQIINLLLHGFFITLLMSYMTFPSKIASTSVDGVHTAFLIVFSISFTLKIEEFILLTNVGRFRLVQTCLMWTWSCHNHYTTLKHKLFPQTALIVRSRFVAQAQKNCDMSPMSPIQ